MRSADLIFGGLEVDPCYLNEVQEPVNGLKQIGSFIPSAFMEEISYVYDGLNSLPRNESINELKQLIQDLVDDACVANSENKAKEIFQSEQGKAAEVINDIFELTGKELDCAIRKVFSISTPVMPPIKHNPITLDPTQFLMEGL